MNDPGPYPDFHYDFDFSPTLKKKIFRFYSLREATGKMLADKRYLRSD